MSMSPPKYGDIIVNRNGTARFRGHISPCSLGRTGLVDTKREGDGGTPRGVFRLEHVYYRPDRIVPPKTLLPISPIRRTYGWSDDPCDPLYNQFVDLPHAFRHERLWRSDGLYDCVVVFSANRNPVTPGRGSALFMHVWRGPRQPTAGCVAFAKSTLMALLRQVSTTTRLHIL